MLTAMENLMINLRGLSVAGVPLKKFALFQTSIIMSVRALRALFADMQRKYEVTFIATYKLNQDLLENLFAQARCKGGMNDRPTPLAVTQRIRLIILGKTPSVALARNTNTETDSTDEFLPTQKTAPAPDQTTGVEPEEVDEYLTARVLRVADIVPVVNEQPDPDVLAAAAAAGPVLQQDDVLVHQQERGGFIYLLGRVAFKLKKSHPHLGTHTYKLDNSLLPAFLGNLSYGGLTAPSEEFQQMGLVMEQAFLTWHGAEMFRNKIFVVRKLVEHIMSGNPNFEREIVLRNNIGALQMHIKHNIL